MRTNRLTTVVIGLLLIAAPAAAQNDPPRTAWGQPDLTGVWDFRSITRMERPEDLAGKEFLTEEELADLEQGAVDRLNDFLTQPAQRTVGGGGRRPTAGRRKRFVQPHLARSGARGGDNRQDVTDHRAVERTLPATDIRGASPRRGIVRSPRVISRPTPGSTSARTIAAFSASTPARR